MVLASTTLNTAQNVICVGQEPVSRDQLDPECNTSLCSSVECIFANITDSTHVQFVSQEFKLTESLVIEDRSDIQLVGSSFHGNKTRIVCREHSMEHPKTIGIALRTVAIPGRRKNFTISGVHYTYLTAQT